MTLWRYVLASFDGTRTIYTLSTQIFYSTEEARASFDRWVSVNKQYGSEPNEHLFGFAKVEVELNLNYVVLIDGGPGGIGG